MKKMAFGGCLILFLAPMVYAQEKIEAPVWYVGDKWAFDRGRRIEVTGRGDALRVPPRLDQDQVCGLFDGIIYWTMCPPYQDGVTIDLNYRSFAP